MLQLWATKTKMIVLLLSILALLVIIAAIMVLSHTAINTAALPYGVFGDH